MRQYKYESNIEVRSRNHWYGKAISSTYSECESVVLDIQDAKRMRLPYSKIFFHIIS